MNLTEWEACNDPGVMLRDLQRVRPRKLRLFACACCRRIGPYLDEVDPRLNEAVAVAERFADDQVPLEEMQQASSIGLFLQHAGSWRFNVNWTDCARLIGAVVVEEHAWNAAFGVQNAVRQLLRLRPGGSAEREGEEMKAQVELLRDLFATRYRPRPDLSWLGPHFDLVTDVAAGIYRDRAFGDLPVLADALEEADCPYPEMVAHCRGGGLHARGCWLVDAILGKE